MAPPKPILEMKTHSLKLWLAGAVLVGIYATPLLISKPGPNITICHKGRTITVDEAAVPHHIQQHGDTIGPCQISPN